MKSSTFKDGVITLLTARQGRTILTFAVIGSAVTTVLASGLFLYVAATVTQLPADHGLRTFIAAPLVPLSAWLLTMIPAGLTGLAAVAIEGRFARYRAVLCVLAGGALGAGFDLILHGDPGASLQYAALGAISAGVCAWLTTGRERRTSSQA